MKKIWIVSVLFALAVACTSDEQDSEIDREDRADVGAEAICIGPEGGEYSVGTELEGETCTSDGYWYAEVCESSAGVPYERPAQGCPCLFDQNAYPPGTVVGGLTCAGDSHWYEEVCEVANGISYERPEEGCSCFYNGDPYPTGFIQGPYECDAGVWER
jgi:hypothetical protein